MPNVTPPFTGELWSWKEGDAADSIQGDIKTPRHSLEPMGKEEMAVVDFILKITDTPNNNVT